MAARAEAPLERGLAGPGLLAYIVTSKFSDYLPLYRLEDIFARQGFEIARATQSVWCGDVADLVEPLYQRLAERVRASHVVATDDTVLPMLQVGKTHPARMWVYVGDADCPYNVLHPLRSIRRLLGLACPLAPSFISYTRPALPCMYNYGSTWFVAITSYPAVHTPT